MSSRFHTFTVPSDPALASRVAVGAVGQGVDGAAVAAEVDRDLGVEVPDADRRVPVAGGQPMLAVRAEHGRLGRGRLRERVLDRVASRGSRR